MYVSKIGARVYVADTLHIIPILFYDRSPHHREAVSHDTLDTEQNFLTLIFVRPVCRMPQSFLQKHVPCCRRQRSLETTTVVVEAMLVSLEKL